MLTLSLVNATSFGPVARARVQLSGCRIIHAHELPAEWIGRSTNFSLSPASAVVAIATDDDNKTAERQCFIEGTVRLNR